MGQVMKPNVGENLVQEWEREPFASELWDAISLIKNDTEKGIEALHTLIAKGSPLAMMYLGQYSIWGDFGVPQDDSRAEFLLRQASELKSIEGAYRLAKLLRKTGRSGQAIEIWERLAERGFGPAQYLMGLHYMKGEIVPEDISRSQGYLSDAEKSGHIPAKRLYAKTLMRSGNPLKILKGLGKFLGGMKSFVETKRANPESDRLRI
jgi:TPR repeat protein